MKKARTRIDKLRKTQQETHNAIGFISEEILRELIISNGSSSSQSMGNHSQSALLWAYQFGAANVDLEINGDRSCKRMNRQGPILFFKKPLPALFLDQLQ